MNEIGEMIVKIPYQRLHEVVFKIYINEAKIDDKHIENLIKMIYSLFKM